MATQPKRVRRIKPPATVDLSYQKLKIGFSKNLGEDAGLYHAGDHQVVLQEGQKWHEEANTLLHELLHAICHCYNLDLSYKLEEKVVSNLTNGLMEVLSRNPELLKYFNKVWNANRQNSR